MEPWLLLMAKPSHRPCQGVLQQSEEVICPVCKTRGLARRQKLIEAEELEAGTFRTPHLKAISGVQGWSKADLRELWPCQGWDFLAVVTRDHQSCLSPGIAALSEVK